MKSKKLISKVTALSLVGVTLLGSGTSVYAKTRRISYNPPVSCETNNNGSNANTNTGNSNSCPDTNTGNNNSCPDTNTGNNNNCPNDSTGNNNNRPNGGTGNNDRPGTGTGSGNNNNTSTDTSNQKSLEDQVLVLVNKERTKNNLSPLTMDEDVRKVARAKSSDMSSKKYFDHTSPTYGTPFDMLKSFGISYKSAGENIAQGYKTAESVVNGWMNSPGHRANILNASYTKIGVGYEANGNYWTQLFIG